MDGFCATGLPEANDLRCVKSYSVGILQEPQKLPYLQCETKKFSY